MRLICPNCDAEYEVEAELIPDTGRDVQCSNCGHGWFQLSPEAEALALAAGGEPRSAPPPAPAPERPASPGPDPDPEDAADTPSDGAMPPPMREIDPSVLEVLREEAERETRARRQEAAPLEVQGEMGLETAASGRDEQQARQSRLRAVEERALSASGARRQTLPQVETITATLDPRTGGAAAEGPAAPRPAAASGSGAFRIGFLLAMTLVIVGGLTYLYAPVLAQRFPDLAEPLDSYSRAVDGLRRSLDGALRGLAERVSALMGRS
ncbi:MAG: zinc-ribbon domain-containing protein [Paracoccaceae bacterium]